MTQKYTPEDYSRKGVETGAFNSQQTPREDIQPGSVALIYMPLALLKLPALGISLLKAGLARRGIDCDIYYLNFTFAEWIDPLLYAQIMGINSRLFLGDWLFAKDLFDNNEKYNITSECTINPIQPDCPECFMEQLTVKRNKISEYLDRCMSTVPWSSYKIIGFSSIFQQNVSSLALARRIKLTWPEVLTVFGGANCEGEMGLELHRQFPFIDIICRGECDNLFPILVECLLAGKPPPRLPGLIIREKDGSTTPVSNSSIAVFDLDTLPNPDFDDYFDQLHSSSLASVVHPELVFESSRGCWYGYKQHCRFCGYNGERISYRRKSPNRVFAELNYLTHRHDIRQILATDSILDMRLMGELATKIIDHKLDWSFYYMSKANLRKNQLRLLKQAGLYYFIPGIESLSTNILRLMKKGCTMLQNVQLLKWTSELGFDVGWSILTGTPGEEAQDYSQMAELIPSLLHLPPPFGIGPMRLERFSPYFEAPESWGITHVRPLSIYHTVYPLPDESLNKLAYYFDFDFVDGRDPNTYISPLIEMLHYWQNNYCPGGLTSLSSSNSIIIYDRRPCAVHARYEFTGLKQAVYIICDETHTINGIYNQLKQSGYMIDRETLLQWLEEFVADKLMVREGNWYLALAVPIDQLANELSRSDIIQRAFAENIANSLNRSLKVI